MSRGISILQGMIGTNMKRIAILLPALLLAACVRNGIAERMGAVLEKMETEMGYVNTLDDADVEKVADWFERHGTPSEKSRALFCLGRNQFNSGRYAAAIVTDTRAMEHARTASDTLAVARIARDMAHTCNATLNTADELRYLGQAAEAFRAAGRADDSQQALLEIGIAHAGLGNHARAEDLFKSVLYDAHENRDTLLEARCLEAYADLAISRDTAAPVLAIELLSRAADDLHYPLSCADKGTLAYAYSLIGHAAEAAKWLSAARTAAETEDEQAAVAFRDYQIAARGGRTAEALAALEKVTEYGNRSQTQALQAAVASTQREYIQGQSIAQAEKLRSARMKLWVLGLGALLTLAAAAAVYFSYRAQQRRLEAEQAETEKYMNIAEDLQARLVSSRKRLPSEKHLALSKFDALERLCEQYYVYEGTENLQPKILQEVRSIVEGLRSDPKTQQGLDTMLDRNLDGVMTKLRAEFPAWKPEDYLLYGFTAAGLSSTTISTLLRMEKSVVYNRLYRLKGRISESEPALRDFFLGCLNN